MNKSLQKLLKLFLFFLLGNLLASGILAGVAASQGFSLTDLAEMGADPSSLPASVLKPMIWVQTVCVFILPAIAYWLTTRNKSFLSDFDLDRMPGLSVMVISILIMGAGYPLVQLSFMINSLIPLPEWAVGLEDDAAGILSQILNMDSFGSYLTALFIIAVLPAVGEELIFRGILQKEAGNLVNSPVAGIWIAAFLFSLIHFQFAGFLPRVVLGAILGYLYYWTKSLWVPIVIHFLNNGVQVTVLYAMGLDLNTPEEEPSIQWWVIAVSAVAFAFLVKILLNQVAAHGQE